MGQFRGDGGIWSRFDWDDRGSDRKYVEQQSVVKVDAEFSDDVCAHFALESYDVWGEDFRSINYVTGADARAATGDDVEFIKANIEVKDMFGTPVSMKVGRQLFNFGKGWLVAPKFSGTKYCPFDGVKFTYKTDVLAVDAFWSKLQENSPGEEDGDVDFYGVYGTYSGMEAINVSAYWFLLRDAREIHDVNGTIINEWLENVFNVDDYDVTNLHTIGVRLFGEYSAFDYDVEMAYQFGEADSTGVFFVPVNNVYGDDDAEFGNFAMDLEVGYTFDTTMQPRAYVGGTYFGGEDNRDTSLFQYLNSLANPFYEGEASVSFNRLFSGKDISSMLDSDQLWSNVWTVRAGCEFAPMEKVSAQAQIAYYGVVEPFDRPVVLGDLGGGFFGGFDDGGPAFALCPLLPVFPWWTTESADDLGWETTLKLKYNYSKDLYFAVGWCHMFVGDGMTDGNFSHLMGTTNTMGSDNDGADYLYWDTAIKF